MKLKSIIFLIALLLTSLPALSQNNNKAVFKTQMDSVAYSIGISFGRQLKQDNINLNLDIFLMAVKDAMVDTSQLTDEQMQQAMIAFQKSLMQRQQEQLAQQAAIEKAKGIKFLEENKKRQGVKTTSSGLQYEVLVEGKGKKPTQNSTVKVHYTGKLIDGSTFDSSIERNEPIEFPLNKVIPGWTEGVQLMSIGSKYRFYIPSELAYGDQGYPPTIPPGATLIFEVELLDIIE